MTKYFEQRLTVVTFTLFNIFREAFSRILPAFLDNQLNTRR